MTPPLTEPLLLRSAAGLHALLNQPGIGLVRALALAREFTTWDELLTAPQDARRRIGGKAAADTSSWRPPPALPVPVGARVLSMFDPDYPEVLTELPDPPALLWVRGTLPTNETIAIVGTREPTRHGVLVTQATAASAARAGLGVISGHARGVDSIAEQACLKAGGGAWAVLGSGLDALSPTQRELAERLVASGGGVLSELTPTVPAAAHTLITRTRLVVALSRVVVVTQAGLNSGTRHAARYALQHGRCLAVAAPLNEAADKDESGLNLALVDPAGCQPETVASVPANPRSVAHAAQYLAGRRPAADVVLHSPLDLAPLWTSALDDTTADHSPAR